MAKKRFNRHTRDMGESEKVDAFLRDLMDLYDEHSLSLSHEDLQGGFIVEENSDSNNDWVWDASMRIDPEREANERRQALRELISYREKGRIGDWEELKRGICQKRTFVREALDGDICPMVVRGHEGRGVVWALKDLRDPGDDEFFAAGVTDTHEQAMKEADEALANLTEDSQPLDLDELPTDHLIKHDLL